MGVDGEGSRSYGSGKQQGDPSPAPWLFPPAGRGECWYHRLDFSRLRAAISVGVAMVTGAPATDREEWVALSGAR